jgi:putative ABC transport system permease protein
LKYADKDPLTIKNLIFADPDFFNIFSFYSIKGNLQTALKDPGTVVLTETEAERIFGNEDPINKTIRLNNELDLTVKAVIKDIPQNSSMKFGGVASLLTIKSFSHGHDPFGWPYSDYETYILSSENISTSDFYKKIEKVTKNYIPVENKDLNTEIFPLNDIYYDPELSNFHNHGTVEKSFILISIALLILLIAVVNFINLSTARASMRTKEMGVRKAIGASRFTLIKQFLSESIVISFISMVLAVLLASELIVLFNQLTDLRLSVFNGSVLNRIIIYSAGALLLGILAGIYPAFYLSSFKPGLILRGEIHQKKGKAYLRKILIVFQFSAAVLLIVSTFVIYYQLEYLKNKPLGFQKEDIIYLPANREIFENKDVFKDKIFQIPGVKDFAYSSAVPGEMSLIWEHNLKYGGKESNIRFTVVPTSCDFMRLMGMKITDGRTFYENNKNDEWNIIINEAFAQKYGLKEPFKAQFAGMPGDGKIVGVVKDFNFKSLHSPVEPLVFINAPNWFLYGVVKISSAKYTEIKRVINRFGSIWKEVSPDFPFEYNFLQENLALQYKSEERFEKAFICFSALAIIISCFGLFGLISFTTEHRTKEIGIRKVLGASTSGITAMLSKQFVVLVFIAIIIASPIAYYIANKWLQNFAYRIEISWWMFALAGGIALVIALVTISFQAIKAAMKNPVESLKYE